MFSICCYVYILKCEILQAIKTLKTGVLIIAIKKLFLFNYELKASALGLGSPYRYKEDLIISTFPGASLSVHTDLASLSEQRSGLGPGLVIPTLYG